MLCATGKMYCKIIKGWRWTAPERESILRSSWVIRTGLLASFDTAQRFGTSPVRGTGPSTGPYLAGLVVMSQHGYLIDSKAGELHCLVALQQNYLKILSFTKLFPWFSGPDEGSVDNYPIKSWSPCKACIHAKVRNILTF